ncbi:hypothetical protein PM082_014962 [Marasmius tenuissimus]|nr:hypothetical protein PM082_014962 [Marasmius tenuissimus]
MIENVPLVAANLASMVIEPILYGFFLLLSGLSVYAILKTDGESTPQHGRNLSSGVVTFASLRRTIKRPLFVGGLAMIGTVTAHLICSSIRLFIAILRYDDPTKLYEKLSHPSQAIKVALQIASLILGDSIMIYRLWVVCNRQVAIIVCPVLTNLGLVVAGVGFVYQLTIWKDGDDIYAVEGKRWITTEIVLTLCCECEFHLNFQAQAHMMHTVLIALHIWNQRRETLSFSVTSESNLLTASIQALASPLMLTTHLQRAFTVFVESATLYTIWTTIWLASYETKNPLHSFMANCHATIAGISVMSIKTRMFFSSKASNSHKNTGSTSTTDSNRRYPAPNEDVIDTRDGYSLRPIPPVAVKISRIVEREDAGMSSKGDIFDP